MSKLEPRPCVQCGKAYQPSRSTQKTCSDECRRERQLAYGRVHQRELYWGMNEEERRAFSFHANHSEAAVTARELYRLRTAVPCIVCGKRLVGIAHIPKEQRDSYTCLSCRAQAKREAEAVVCNWCGELVARGPKQPWHKTARVHYHTECIGGLSALGELLGVTRERARQLVKAEQRRAVKAGAQITRKQAAERVLRARSGNLVLALAAE